MENRFEDVIETLLDYYCNFSPDSRIVEMIQCAGEKAGLVQRGRFLDDAELNMAAAGDSLKNFLFDKAKNDFHDKK
ncbi:MAG: hypothetical protein LBT68_03720 [Spirochaetales bacterium]|nr:hypothetical protein [Spirochaetales bacterium]